MNDGGLKRVSGLWLKDGRTGKFMSGQTDADIPAGAKLLIFKNDRKQSENQPDYTLFVVSEDDGDRQSHRGNGRHSSNGQARHQAAAAPPSAPPPPTQDEIPF